MGRSRGRLVIGCVRWVWDVAGGAGSDGVDHGAAGGSEGAVRGLGPAPEVATVVEDEKDKTRLVVVRYLLEKAGDGTGGKAAGTIFAVSG